MWAPVVTVFTVTMAAKLIAGCWICYVCRSSDEYHEIKPQMCCTS